MADSIGFRTGAAANQAAEVLAPRVFDYVENGDVEVERIAKEHLALTEAFAANMGQVETALKQQQIADAPTAAPAGGGQTATAPDVTGANDGIKVVGGNGDPLPPWVAESLDYWGEKVGVEDVRAGLAENAQRPWFNCLTAVYPPDHKKAGNQVALWPPRKR